MVSTIKEHTIATQLYVFFLNLFII